MAIIVGLVFASLLLGPAVVCKFRRAQTGNERTSRSPLDEVERFAYAARTQGRQETLKALLDSITSSTGFRLSEQLQSALIRREVLFRSGEARSETLPFPDAFNAFIRHLDTATDLSTTAAESETLRRLLQPLVPDLIGSQGDSADSPFSRAFMMLTLLRQKGSAFYVDPDSWVRGVEAEQSSRTRKAPERCVLRIAEVPTQTAEMINRVSASMKDPGRAEALAQSF